MYSKFFNTLYEADWLENSTKPTEKRQGQYAPAFLVSKTKERGLSPLTGRTFSLSNKNIVLRQEAAVGYHAGRRDSSVGGMMASVMEKHGRKFSC